jgi:probable DNA metabolism protein
MFAVFVDNFETWRLAARNCVLNDVRPDEVVWSETDAGLFDSPPAVTSSPDQLVIPRTFVESAKRVAMHREPSRWNLLYRVLYRLTHGEKQLMRIEVDDDIRQIHLLEKAVSRDMHKMKAFVRFRLVPGSEPEQFVAWHRPDHHIVDAMAPWFAARFGSMHWAILTPDRSARWDLQELSFGPGVPLSQAPQADALEDLWRNYYSSILNPARVKIKAMKTEMPVRHWATLPEAQVISKLLCESGARVNQMKTEQHGSAAEWAQVGEPVEQLREAAKQCEGCDLFRHASQVVFGEGPSTAKTVMVGEQPGDEEDLRGKPFVGPAGRLLDKALAEAGVDRTIVYVTNAVKHFKFEQRGKRRIHSKPSGTEVSACRPWLEAELTAIKPELIVCLGATAAQSLMGRDFRVTTERGQFFPHRWAKELMATIHPSAILRMDPAMREREYELLVNDLKLVAQRMA